MSDILRRPQPDLTMARTMIDTAKLADDQGCGIAVRAGWGNNVRFEASDEVPKGEVWLYATVTTTLDGIAVERCTHRYRLIGWDETVPSYTLEVLP